MLSAKVLTGAPWRSVVLRRSASVVYSVIFGFQFLMLILVNSAAKAISSAWGSVSDVFANMSQHVSSHVVVVLYSTDNVVAQISVKQAPKVAGIS